LLSDEDAGEDALSSSGLFGTRHRGFEIYLSSASEVEDFIGSFSRTITRLNRFRMLNPSWIHEWETKVSRAQPRLVFRKTRAYLRILIEARKVALCGLGEAGNFVRNCLDQSFSLIEVCPAISEYECFSLMRGDVPTFYARGSEMLSGCGHTLYDDLAPVRDIRFHPWSCEEIAAQCDLLRRRLSGMVGGG
jgi:hypothetical protein